MKTLAIVGSFLAGFSAARAARSEGLDGTLVLVEDEPHSPCGSLPLSKDFLNGKIAEGHSFLTIYHRGDDPVGMVSGAQARFFAKRRRDVERSQRVRGAETHGAETHGAPLN